MTSIIISRHSTSSIIIIITIIKVKRENGRNFAVVLVLVGRDELDLILSWGSVLKVPSNISHENIRSKPPLNLENQLHILDVT